MRPIGSFLTLLFVSLAPAWAGEPIQLKANKGAVEFYVGSELVTRYLHGENWAKPIFYPVNAPGGIPLTRSWPIDTNNKDEATDHPHQKSAWFCHGDVFPEGLDFKSEIRGVRGADFWSENKTHGKIVCTHVGEPKVEGNHGILSTKNEWRTSAETKIMDENRVWHFYNLPKGRLIVAHIDLIASVCPITFDDTKEGAFGIRINEQMKEGKTILTDKDGKKRELKGNGLITNAEGKKTEKECWGQISEWCDYSGKVDQKEAGLTVFADPKNPHPTCWHARGYGLMAGNPFGRAKSGFPAMKGRSDLVKLAKGGNLRLRYAMYLHTGNAQSGAVADAFKQFVEMRGKEN